MFLSGEQVRERQMRCINEGLCFVSLRPIPHNATKKEISIVPHYDSYISVPILVLKEYVK